MESSDCVDWTKGSCKMSVIQRDLYFRLMDGKNEVVPILFQIHNYRHSFDIAKWLLENKITGSILLDFMKIKFENSILEMVKFIISKINKDKELKPIYAHKDYKV